MSPWKSSLLYQYNNTVCGCCHHNLCKLLSALSATQESNFSLFTIILQDSREAEHYRPKASWSNLVKYLKYRLHNYIIRWICILIVIPLLLFAPDSESLTLHSVVWGVCETRAGVHYYLRDHGAVSADPNEDQQQQVCPQHHLHLLSPWSDSSITNIYQLKIITDFPNVLDRVNRSKDGRWHGKVSYLFIYLNRR